jgi:hypothetical protein
MVYWMMRFRIVLIHQMDEPRENKTDEHSKASLGLKTDLP